MPALLQLELFSLASILFVILMLFLTHKYVSENKRKYCYLASAILCVLVHYSYFLYQLITGTVDGVPANLYLPQWPCNIMMWLILVVAVMNFYKENLVLKYLYYITSWVGVFCAILGLCCNFNFLGTPDFSDYNIFKGLLSHVFLLYCCLYPFVERKADYEFFKVTLSLIISGVIFVVCGNYSVIFSKLIGQSIGSSILDSPFDNLPWLNIYVLFPIIIVLWLIVSTIYEIIVFEKGNRWFNKFHNIKKELKGE